MVSLLLVTFACIDWAHSAPAQMLCYCLSKWAKVEVYVQALTTYYSLTLFCCSVCTGRYECVGMRDTRTRGFPSI